MLAKTEEANLNFEKVNLLEKEKKDLMVERDKMKDRIKRLKMKRGKFDIAEKVCKNCSKDFLESENFNWSCRIHRSQYSGEIWWCCGKAGFEQAGCKYSKHESKEEEDEENDEG
jgi:hypothetical protein